MPSTNRIRCNVCNPPIEFPSPDFALRHHIEQHSTHKCKLCDSVISGGKLFCASCRENFPATLKYETMARNVEAMANHLAERRSELSRAYENIKGSYLKHKHDLYCDHDMPKSADCQKCADRAARHNPAPRTYAEVQFTIEEMKEFGWEIEEDL